MARFLVYSSTDTGRLLLDVQTDLLESFNTRVVVPLFPLEQMSTPAQRLNPVFEISGEKMVMVTQYIASVPIGVLGEPIGDLSFYQDEVSAALDMLFLGF